MARSTRLRLTRVLTAFSSDSAACEFSHLGIAALLRLMLHQAGFSGTAAFLFIDSWGPAIDASFNVYGGGASFLRPPPPEPMRQLSPTKPDRAHFFAVFEYTMYHDWWSDVTVEPVNGRKSERKAMSRRLEIRLAQCLQRFNDVPGNTRTSDILDVVAVVGIVSQIRCEEAVTELLSKDKDCPFLLLQRMFCAHRFVHFYKAFMLQGSPIPLAPSVMPAAADSGAPP